MRYLVTGGTGYIGRALVPKLLELGPVTLLVRELYGSGEPLPPPLSSLRADLDLLYADLRNLQLTSRALRAAEPECVIHLAARGVTDPFLSPHTALSHNLTGTLNLLRASFESVSTVNRLIAARTPGEETAMNVYAASKAAAWNFCQMYARTARWPIVGAMIFQAYGPGQPVNLLVPAAVRSALAGEDFPMSSGNQEKDWIYIDDVVDGLLASARADLLPGTTVELGTGVATSIRAVAERVYDLVGQGGQPLPGSIPDRPGEVRQQVADVESTYRLTGWRSKVELRNGLERVVVATRPASASAQMNG